jgi:hypothetical protein
MRNALTMATIMAIGLAGVAVSSTVAATWVDPDGGGNDGGQWNTASNWSPADIPNTAAESAVFNGDLGNDKIQVDGTDVTIGSLTITNTNKYNPIKFEDGNRDIHIADGGAVTVLDSGADNGGVYSYGSTGNDLIFDGDGTMDIRVETWHFRNGGRLKAESGTLTKLGAGEIQIYNGAACTVLNLDWQGGTLDMLMDNALTVTGLATVADGTTIDLNDDDSTWNALTVGGSGVPAGTYTAAQLNAASGTAVFQGSTGTLTVTVSPAVVPEPVSAMAVALGIGVLGGYLRRRRS